MNAWNSVVAFDIPMESKTMRPFMGEHVSMRRFPQPDMDEAGGSGHRGKGRRHTRGTCAARGRSGSARGRGQQRLPPRPRGSEARVWRSDRSRSGLVVRGQTDLEQSGVIFPKLFRRLTEYLRRRGGELSEFPPWLELTREQVLELPTTNVTRC